MKDKLTPKQQTLTIQQQAFADFHEDTSNRETYGNVKRSYMKAYPNSSEKAAESNGIRLIRKDKIISYIANIRADRQVRYEYNQQISIQMHLDLLQRCRVAGDRTTEARVLAELDGIHGLRTENVHQSGAGLNVNIAQPDLKKQKEDNTSIATLDWSKPRSLHNTFE